MRILQVNKFGTATTGAENYFLGLTSHLAESGHEVAVVCMRPTDVPDGVPVYEVPDIDFHTTHGVRARIGAARRVWDFGPAQRAVERAIREHRPEVVHFHNIAHQLSQSVVSGAIGLGARTVMTCHDYKLICPAYIAMRDGRPCLDCASGTTTGCAAHRCLHGSLSWSGLAALEAARMRRKERTRVPRTLICPSEFLASELRASWIGQTDVSVIAIPNPVDAPPPTPRSVRAPAIYVGRLSAEKGIDIAVRAAAKSGVELLIVGDGPEAGSLRSLAEQLSAPVRFTGFLRGHDFDLVWGNASCQVIPSIWPENGPLAAIEGLMRGLPLIASNVGGLPEMVQASRAGTLVEPGQVDELAAAMRRGFDGELGIPDVAGLTARHSWRTHLGRVLSVYRGEPCE
jgi:glycosyltransferase involved in cell wall biosynthesis